MYNVYNKDGILGKALLAGYEAWGSRLETLEQQKWGDGPTFYFRLPVATPDNYQGLKHNA
jgi:hypothetical protein